MGTEFWRVLGAEVWRALWNFVTDLLPVLRWTLAALPGRALVAAEQALTNLEQGLTEAPLRALWAQLRGKIPSIPQLRTRVMTLDAVLINFLTIVAVDSREAFREFKMPTEEQFMVAAKRQLTFWEKLSNLPKWLSKLFQLTALRLLTWSWKLTKIMILTLGTFTTGFVLLEVGNSVLQRGVDAPLFAGALPQNKARRRGRQKTQRIPVD